jgi:hypothetical protein
VDFLGESFDQGTLAQAGFFFLEILMNGVGEHAGKKLLCAERYRRKKGSKLKLGLLKNTMVESIHSICQANERRWIEDFFVGMRSLRSS